LGGKEAERTDVATLGAAFDLGGRTDVDEWTRSFTV